MSRPSSVSPRLPSSVPTGGGLASSSVAAASGGGRSRGLKDIRIDEEVKIAVNIALERFRYGEQREMEFPSSLTSTERAFIHRLSQSLGLISKSKGAFLSSMVE
uniref:R3H domain-containing protein n=1 Tax=Sphenodon punctatus TaxID=8508 RepID=A0A8D0HF19_SPHPU